ncbi:tRNA uridine-5-carboxymethylaminomethyl(34) synthesis GTPase MnmE [Puniceicoccales bacterium CK1056]|uniref:tRNA modification GTPase MnmE n=1 Tax=Oceanipulchritudo coccoides TaxID=2706888 RepID=A0A6B2M2X9_9BACT|nr:tRNA uridine-5-carboxymethylaminomethyl(34) synthesis GTPase MnmE [Oceanipulchritudo coccoides]NDV62165.1 tRNA uridine-5-carboxymethylaminomethyl(34) synthesis GTPase MnmE [Oceanipulchritudo coccoides]
MTPIDTIIAPATASGEAALAVIRVSGPLVPELVEAIFGKAPLPRQVRLGRYLSTDGRTLDTLIYTVYEEGKSYSGDWLLELTPHGNPWLVRKILDDLLGRGCRLAEAGEFTRRAFLNGKLDLSQAEAVVQVIQARSERALEAARRQLSGSVGRTVDSLVDRLLVVTAMLEAYIDFPEEDLPPEDQKGPAQALSSLVTDMESLIATRQYASLLHDGVKCVILGEPNVGKSSLLNALTGEDRVIVSAEPGTTRDYVEERIHIGPYLLRIIDTAGLHEAASSLEEEGIHRSLEQIESADLLLVVLDSTRPAPTLPDPVVRLLNERNTVVVVNKVDLAEGKDLAAFAADCPHVPISAAKQTGLNDLREVIRRSLEEGLVIPDESAVIVSARHAEALAQAKSLLQESREKLREGLPAELVASDLHAAIESMGLITGKIDNESILDRLFNRFCIGK